jgi:hypothetical protein
MFLLFETGLQLLVWVTVVRDTANRDGVIVTHDVDMKKSYYQEINAMLDKFYASIKDEDCG